MNGEVLGRAREDMLKSERDLRALTEGQNRELRTILRDLAYRLAGEEIERIRHSDPLAPDDWPPERWGEFFRASLQATASGWDNPASFSSDLRQARDAVARLQADHRSLQARLDAALAEAQQLRSGSDASRKAAQAASVVAFPEIPRKPPARHAVQLGTGSRWRREAMVIYLMAALGRSVRLEILDAVGQSEGVGGRSGSLKRVFASGLVPGGFVEESVLAMKLSRGPTRLAVVRLSERGQELAQALGWEPVESEWGRLLRLHQGEVQEAHTAAVLAFAFHARRRGWQAQVVPEVKEAAQPDAFVERENDQAYVEVELGNEKSGKWRNLSALQGFVALCAATELRRAQLVAECKLDRLAGRATDLETLIQFSGGATNGRLWAEEWGAD